MAANLASLNTEFPADLVSIRIASGLPRLAVRFDFEKPHGDPHRIDIGVIGNQVAQALHSQVAIVAVSSAVTTGGIVCIGWPRNVKQRPPRGVWEILSSLVFWEFSLGGFLHDSVDEFLAL